MLTLYQSNRLEHLADALAALVRDEPGLPLREQPVLVSSPGMGTWLQIRLARALGVAAGFRFLLPARWLWQQYRHLHGDELPERSAWDKGPLGWMLWQRLDEALADPDCAMLRRYLEDGDALRRFRLCQRLADLYDQYQMHRPDWLAAWARGDTAGVVPEDQRWQPALWRLLQRWLPADSARRALLLDVENWRRLIAAAGDADLPDRLILFATGNLSAPLVGVLNALAERIPVHLFLLNPSEHLWTDLRTEREQLREMIRANAAPEDGLAAGNPLLASLGGQGREQWSLLLALCEPQEPDLDLFEPPAADSVLGRLQYDIFALRDGADAPAPLPAGERGPEASARRSISLNVCHSPMREVEVLHEHLCDLFDADPTLRPQDVIVMVPDVAPYAPLVEAVFGQAGRPRIPWAVADRSLADEVPLVRAFLALLRPSVQRFTASEVLDLLETPALRARFGFAVEDLPLLRRWIAEAGIRWGLDGPHRQRLGFPPLDDNTWLRGLERIMLAVAAGEDTHVWQGVVSLAGITEQQTHLAARLAALVGRLARAERDMGRARTVTAWRDLLGRLLDDLFRTDDAAEGLHLEQIRDALGELVAEHEAVGAAGELPVEVIHEVLASRLRGTGTSQRFLTGAVNVCTLMPMRAVPFRVVCLLGMNETDYPHREHPPGYDLMARHRRFGDRSRRLEDRYLFLEALLSARDRFYVSWVGRDVRSNEPLPPSVVVADLIDTLDRTFTVDGDTPASQHLLTEHPLQPFSPGNFLRRGWAPLWHQLAAGTAPARDDGDDVLPPPEPIDALTLDELQRFLLNPAREFLARRLRARLDVDDLVLEDDEPLCLDGLAAWQLRDASVRERLEAPGPLPLLARWRAEGRLPPGSQGEREFIGLARAADEFSRRVASLWPDTATTRSVVLDLDGVRLTADIDGCHDDGWLFWSASAACRRCKARAEGLRALDGPRERPLLACWLRHLMLNTLDLPPAARTGLALFEDLRLRLAPLPAAEARQMLADLLAMFRAGLAAPLAFTARAGWEAAVAEADPLPVFRDHLEADPSGRRLHVTLPDAESLRALGQTLWGGFVAHATVEAHDD